MTHNMYIMTIYGGGKDTNQTLCVEGSLKRRANKNMQWTYFE